MQRGILTAVAATAALLTIAGCSASPQGDAGADKAPVVEGDWEAAYDDFFAEHGKLPSETLLDEDEALAILADQQTTAWKGVLLKYPNAQYPAEGFVRWQLPEDQDSSTSDLANCYIDHGLTIDTAIDASGAPVGVGSSGPATVETAVAQFYCSYVAYPPRPQAAPSAEMLGYIWEYANQFLAPCLEAHGYPQQPLPQKRSFVTKPTGYPSFADVAPEDYATVEAACPADPIQG